MAGLRGQCLRIDCADGEVGAGKLPASNFELACARRTATLREAPHSTRRRRTPWLAPGPQPRPCPADPGEGSEPSPTSVGGALAKRVGRSGGLREARVPPAERRRHASRRAHCK